MLIYGVSGIFAHKKTIKQFLQPMIELVWGDMPGGCAAFFASVFQSYCIFVSVLFNSPMPFFGSFAYFCCILCVFHQKSNNVLGTKFS